MSERFVFHVQLESFFSGIELGLDPSLRGRRFAVGGTPDLGGVVVGLSPEARRSGIHLGMEIKKAASLVPSAIFLPGRPRLYSNALDQLLSRFLAETPSVELLSATSFYVDGTELVSSFRDAVTWARDMQRSLEREQQIRMGFGIGANKLVARMCSGLEKKPGSITCIGPGEFLDVFHVRPLESLPGLSATTVQALRGFGMATIGDLAKTDPESLRPYFGQRGAHWIELANGMSEASVRPVDRSPRGPIVERRGTLEAPATDRPRIRRLIARVSALLEKALNEDHRKSDRFELEILWDDFTATVQRIHRDVPVSSVEEIDAGCQSVFGRFDLGGGVRSVGIVASGLTGARVRSKRPAPFVLTPD